MSKIINISKNVYWLGENDRRTHLFENYWPLEKGVSYNSYLINDNKTALIDTIEISKADVFLEKIKKILNNKPLDYLVINHMEPDHSGAIKTISRNFPNVKIIGNKNTLKIFEGFFGETRNFQTINDGDEIGLGNHKLKFYMTPMLHWPETMMTYELNNKILFSGDAFGSFGTLDGGIFDDELNLDFYYEEIRRYYSNIVAKYANPVQKALQKLKNLDIKIIASTHGPVWRSNINEIVNYYDKWSKYETEKGVVIVFGSMYGNTEQMAEIIAHKLCEEGIKNIRIYDVSKTHISFILNDIWKYKGLILGSPAYNGNIFPPMEHLISKLQNTGLKNHLLGIFGSYCWGGGGVKALNNYVEKSEMELVADPVEAKCSPKDNEIEYCENIAVNMAKILKECF
ncbi:MAG: FprA family A-type flavoprotein [Bacteroidales bacterium]|nr:FprA family A-type flavoprotein [Bacteroidales bacterium]